MALNPTYLPSHLAVRNMWIELTNKNLTYAYLYFYQPIISNRASQQHIAHLKFNKDMTDRVYTLPLPLKGSDNPNQGHTPFRLFALLWPHSRAQYYAPRLYIHVHIWLPLSPLQSDWFSSRWRIGARVHPFQVCMDMIGLAIAVI